MNISVIGGDSRIIELTKILENEGNKQNDSKDKKEKNEILLFGQEEYEELKEFKRYFSLKDTIENSDIIITSIPISKDGITVNAPYTKKQIFIKEIFEIANNKKIITGNITEAIQKHINVKNNNEIIDILKNEELAILNSIPTAEGAIQIAMEKSKITIHNSNCLVMGFGRIGKILSKMLIGIGANVYCEARKSTDIAYIKSYGYNAIHLNELNKNLEKFDFIFNTIPFIILNNTNLNNVKKECLIVDLASKPGGIDFEYAKNIGLQTEWALALPR